MRILAVSDRVNDRFHASGGLNGVRDVDLILSCGDLPYDYLEYLATLIDAPLLYVLGNHDGPMLRESGAVTSEPEGGINLNGAVRAVRLRSGGVALAAGLAGTHRCGGEDRYVTEWNMALRAMRLLPRLLWHRVRHGRALDILISHAPPAGIHEGHDRCHRGFRALRWLIRRFRPAVALHGHIHPSYGVDTRPAQVGPTRILNVYGSTVLEVDGFRE